MCALSRTLKRHLDLGVDERSIGELPRHKVEELIPLDHAVAAPVNLFHRLADLVLGRADANHHQRLAHLLAIAAFLDFTHKTHAATKK